MSEGAKLDDPTRMRYDKDCTKAFKCLCSVFLSLRLKGVKKG